MRGTLLNLGLLAAATMLPAGAAEVNHSWETLEQTLRPGRRVVVTQMNGRRAEGKLLSLSPEAIAVTVNDRPVSIPREDVFRVRIADIRQRHTLIGMAIGAGVGVIWGANLGDFNRGLSAVVLGGIGTGVGAAAGGALPIGAPLYEAPGGLKKKTP